MTTSGISSYSLSRDDIIKSALRKLSALAKGQVPDTEDYTNAALALNTLVARFKTKGMQLWTRKEYSFNPVLNTSSYSIGTGQTLNTPYPLKLLQAFRVDSGSATKVPMEVESNFNFNLMPSGNGGFPIKLVYQPQIDIGTIKLWPTPDANAVNSIITIVYQRPFDYFNASTDTPDFPEEWYDALIYGLAVSLAPEWGVPILDRQALAKEAKEHLDTAMDNGGEDSSIFWQISRKQ